MRSSCANAWPSRAKIWSKVFRRSCNTKCSGQNGTRSLTQSPMLAYLNGQFVAADGPALPLNDRSFLYGDALFETIRITNGQPFLWREHLERLQRGAAFLKIPFAHSSFE